MSAGRDRRNTSRRACGKRRFRDKLEAIRAMHLIQRHGEQRTKTPARAYYCQPCKGWHLTSKPADNGGREATA